jgi:hypothetical protein
MPLQFSTRAGELKINSVSMHCPAWKVHDVAKLWFDSPLRGSYTSTPGVDGEDVVPMRQSSAQWSLKFSMVGDVDRNGDPYAASGGYPARQIGLASNLNYLRTHVLTGRSLTGNRTRTATLQVPGEATPRAAAIHCWLTPPEDVTVMNQHIFQMTLNIRIPVGAFL